MRWSRNFLQEGGISANIHGGLNHPGNAGDFTTNIAESDFRYTQQETPMNNNRGYAWSWWYLLLLAQFVPTLWVPFYNSVEPSWAGIPFFY